MMYGSNDGSAQPKVDEYKKVERAVRRLAGKKSNDDHVDEPAYTWDDIVDVLSSPRVSECSCGRVFEVDGAPVTTRIAIVSVISAS